MDDDGLSGAEAAAEYFAALDAYTQATGNTSEWQAMSHEACDFCADRLAQAKKIASEGWVYKGGETTLQVLHTYDQDAATGVWPLDVRLRVARAILTSPTGEVLDDIAPYTHDSWMEIGRRNGKWVVVGVGDKK